MEKPTRASARRQSAMMAYCGMAAGLSIVIMLLGGVIPAATYAVPMLCGLLLLPILLEFGPAATWTTFAATGLLTLLLGLDKEAAFFYLFLGYYPIVKGRLDKLRRPFRTLAKIALFSLALAAMYGLLYLLFPMAAFMREFGEMGGLLTAVFFIAFVGVLLLYDRVLDRLLLVYAIRIRPKLPFLRR